MRTMGLDLGTVRIGVSLSDVMGWIAQPAVVIRRKDDESDFAEIERIIEENEVSEIVIGLPMNMDGSLGPMAEKVQKFTKELEERFNKPVYEWDERLSSVAAERVLIESNMRRDKRKHVIDKVAAAYILQGFLDKRAMGR